MAISNALLSKKSPCRLFVGALGAVALCAAGLVASAADAPQNTLPLKRIVLFNSGVGFFEHRAEVEGDTQVDLKFNVDDINDLLKSMVLQDLGGGKISTVTYGSKDPITKTLKTFAVDLTENPTLAQLLEQVRGEQVAIQAPNEIIGTIVGVETRKQRVGKDDEVVEVEYLNLLTTDGLRSVPLAQVTKIKLVNEQLDAELRQALAILAMGHATDKKTVSLKFNGQGKRPVQVGYIQEAPIWKTSYRLVLDDKQSPLLQGWAIVENTTEEDWSEVQLTLVSGRPISFVMDLYEPLYMPRPKVEPELFASLRPQKYEGDLAGKEEKLAAGAGGAGVRFQARQRLGRAAGAEAEAAADGAPPAPAAPAETPALGLRMQGGYYADSYAQVGQSVQSVAQAGDVGELFQYAIDAPVTIPRQRSAMLPIVNGPVEAEKVSIYDPQAHPKHPLNGLKLKNSTPLHLMQGPVTVFDGSSYAGDAQIADLPPGAERLVSYAMDLDTEVAPESKSAPEQLTAVKLVKGTLETTRKLNRAVVYTIKNSSDQEKKLLVNYPHDPNWKLVKPEKAEEQTRDSYRFAVVAEPNKPTKLTVEEEQIVSQQVGLSNLDDNMVLFYVNSQGVSAAVKEALQEVIRRRQEVSALSAEFQQMTAQVNAITEEQGRIRQNMERLERNSDLYTRYIKKLTAQEDEIESLRTKIQKLTEDTAAKQKALDEYLIGLSVG